MAAPKSGSFQILLVLAGILVGVGIMMLVSRHPAESGGPSPTLPAPGNSAPPIAERNPASLTSDNSRTTASILADALANSDRDQRAESLRRLATQLTGEDIAKALELAPRISDANDRLEFLRAVFAAWAQRDPKAALEYAKTKFSPGLAQSETVGVALEKWAGQHPQSALQWVEANLSGPLKEQGLVALVQGWSRNDPAGAAAWFAGTGSTSQPVLDAIVSTWADLNPRTAAIWVESLTDPDNKRLGRVSLASEWARQNPAEAAAHFAPQLNEPGGLDLATALVNSWGSADPGAAAQWVLKLPAGPARDDAAGTLATIWAAADINAAIRWTETLTEPTVKAQVIDHLGTTWGAIEPKKALAWLETLPADSTRHEAMLGALNSWAGTDAPGLATWIAGQPLGERTDLARQSLGEVQIDRDPKAALQTALGLSDATLRQDVVTKFHRHWQREDPTAAAAWLREAPLTPELRAALQSPAGSARQVKTPQ